MAGKAIPMGRTRPADKAWLTIVDRDWTWYVLKAYTGDPDAQYARWFCKVVTPYTGPMGDLGDCYISDISGRIIDRDFRVPDEALPAHLR